MKIIINPMECSTILKLAIDEINACKEAILETMHLKNKIQDSHLAIRDCEQAAKQNQLKIEAIEKQLLELDKKQTDIDKKLNSLPKYRFLKRSSLSGAFDSISLEGQLLREKKYDLKQKNNLCRQNIIFNEELISNSPTLKDLKYRLKEEVYNYNQIANQINQILGSSRIKYLNPDFVIESHLSDISLEFINEEAYEKE